VTITALAGTFLALSFDQSDAPGTAPSRLNANSMRGRWSCRRGAEELAGRRDEQHVPAQFTVSAWLKMTATPPPPLVTPPTSCTANRNASSRIQPPIAE
jgi:hypothetical protein